MNFHPKANHPIHSLRNLNEHRGIRLFLRFLKKIAQNGSASKDMGETGKYWEANFSRSVRRIDGWGEKPALGIDIYPG